MFNLFKQTIEIALKKPILNDAVFFKFAFSMSLGNFCGYFSSILQDFPVGSFDEFIQACFPILHGHRHLAQGHILGHIQVGVHQPSQLRHFIFSQVVLGNTDVKLLDFSPRGVLPGRQSHVLLLMICPINNHFSSRVAVNGPMQLVLNRSEKAFCGLSSHIIVDGRGIDIGDLLVKLALGKANFPDTLQLFLEILFRQNGAAAL